MNRQDIKMKQALLVGQRVILNSDANNQWLQDLCWKTTWQMMFYQIWNIFKFRNPLQQANFCKHFTHISKLSTSSKRQQGCFFWNKNRITNHLNQNNYQSNNVSKYQLPKISTFQNWDLPQFGWSAAYLREFPKRFLTIRNFPVRTTIHLIHRFLSIQGAQMMGSSLDLRVAARWGSLLGGVDRWIFGGWHFSGRPCYRCFLKMGAIWV